MDSIFPTVECIKSREARNLPSTCKAYATFGPHVRSGRITGHTGRANQSPDYSASKPGSPTSIRPQDTISPIRNGVTILDSRPGGLRIGNVHQNIMAEIRVRLKDPPRRSQLSFLLHAVQWPNETLLHCVVLTYCAFILFFVDGN